MFAGFPCFRLLLVIWITECSLFPWWILLVCWYPSRSISFRYKEQAVTSHLAFHRFLLRSHVFIVLSSYKIQKPCLSVMKLAGISLRYTDRSLTYRLPCHRCLLCSLVFVFPDSRPEAFPQVMYEGASRSPAQSNSSQGPFQSSLAFEWVFGSPNWKAGAEVEISSHALCTFSPLLGKIFFSPFPVEYLAS